ncbi:MAG: phosphoribosylformimino-5-aminoimidazole carboxamide ribotide isomerase [Clostridiales bacterium]|jgi:phosphoribosylformimino-5-aminoimidazole carboxamide ribotide isomerase|nr:phosphoribosylformimino-5-aminoimidazole carboxamide ribotide isomerase [Clostridiales bacterium]MDK2932719.1 phosphoribosylformimino-5-aminoimidazole carboxamide ribotide isomerase [Clostridiales bacterium]
MTIYPAIDIKQGKCVRLVQGKFSDMTVYSDSPVQMAKKWERLGAKYIHLVDLDGARTGQSINSGIIKEIAKSVTVPVQLGGGIRSLETIKDMLDHGVARVILGTSAVQNPLLLKEAVAKYKEKIVVGIDAKDGKVAIEGWEKVSSFSAVHFANTMQEIGVKTIIYTDISRDGMLKGPNIDAIRVMVESCTIDVIASGGVSSINDIEQLKQTGVEGVIIGKALYTENVDLKDALEIAEER